MKEIFRDRKFVIFCARLIVIFLIGWGLYLYSIRDYANIYYRTYTKEKGWSRWVKNGKTSGNNYPIKAIQVVFKGQKNQKDLSSLDYSCKLKKKKMGIMTSNSKSLISYCGNEKDDIYALRLDAGLVAVKYFDVYYRTYNDKFKWLDWTSNGEYDGYNKLPVKKIQIKLLDKGKSPYKYIKDYGNQLYFNIGID